MYYAAFILGMTASLHCVAMCGPIALALPVHRFSPLRKGLALLIYNTSRAVTYSLFGAALGAAGHALNLPYWQRPFSIAAGTGLLMSVPLFHGQLKTGRMPLLLQKGLVRLQEKMQRLLRKKTLGALALLGGLNGLIPCGMVGIALVGAAAEGGISAGALYMFLYGLGTLPAMLAAGWAGQWISGRLKSFSGRVLPVAAALTGLLLIARGVSPAHRFAGERKEDRIPLCSGVERGQQPPEQAAVGGNPPAPPDFREQTPL